MVDIQRRWHVLRSDSMLVLLKGKLLLMTPSSRRTPITPAPRGKGTLTSMNRTKPWAGPSEAHQYTAARMRQTAQRFGYKQVPDEDAMRRTGGHYWKYKHPAGHLLSILTTSEGPMWSHGAQTKGDHKFFTSSYTPEDLHSHLT